MRAFSARASRRVSLRFTSPDAWLMALLLVGCDGADEAPCAKAEDQVDLLAAITLAESGVGAGVALVRPSDEEPEALPLCGDDRLEVNGVLLEASWDLGYYEAVVEPASTYDVVWIREDGTRHALSGTTPPAFTIDSPAPDASASRADELAVTWSPPRDGAEIQLTLLAQEPGCVSLVETSLPDTGAWMFTAGGIEASAEGPDAQCKTQLALSRETWVQGDPSFLGGNSLLLISQRRERDFLSVP